MQWYECKQFCFYLIPAVRPVLNLQVLVTTLKLFIHLEVKTLQLTTALPDATFIFVILYIFRLTSTLLYIIIINNSLMVAENSPSSTTFWRMLWSFLRRYIVCVLILSWVKIWSAVPSVVQADTDAQSGARGHRGLITTLKVTGLM